MKHILLTKNEAKDELEPYGDEIYDSFDEAQSEAQDAWADGEAVLVAELKEVSWDPPTCAAQTYAGSRHVDPEPPEYCENVTVLGSEYCVEHEDEDR